MKKTCTVIVISVLCLAVTAGLPRLLRAEEKAPAKTIELPAMAFDLANGPDRDRTIAFCGICHGVEYIPMQPPLSRAQWTATVAKMIKAFGAPVPQEDADKIVNYLSAAYGTGK